MNKDRNKVLLLGANGQLGKSLKNILEDKYHVISQTKSQLDITNESKIENTLSKYNPRIVINCAAITNVEECESNISTAFSINENAVRLLAKNCSIRNIPLIHFSTDYVFDGSKLTPYTEKDNENPLNIYGKSKLGGEYQIKKALKKHIIIRTSWVFSEFGNNFVKSISNLLKKKKELRIVKDQIGAPTSTHSISNLVLKILNKYFKYNKFNWGTYHFCQFPYTTWHDFALEILSILSNYESIQCAKIIPIKSSEYNALASRPLDSRLDPRKINLELGLETSYWKRDLEKVVKENEKL